MCTFSSYSRQHREWNIIFHARFSMSVAYINSNEIHSLHLHGRHVRASGNTSSQCRFQYSLEYSSLKLLIATCIVWLNQRHHPNTALIFVSCCIQSSTALPMPYAQQLGAPYIERADCIQGTIYWSWDTLGTVAAVLSL